MFLSEAQQTSNPKPYILLSLLVLLLLLLPLLLLLSLLILFLSLWLLLITTITCILTVSTTVYCVTVAEAEAKRSLGTSKLVLKCQSTRSSSSDPRAEAHGTEEGRDSTN